MYIEDHIFVIIIETKISLYGMKIFIFYASQKIPYKQELGFRYEFVSFAAYRTIPNVIE